MISDEYLKSSAVKENIDRLVRDSSETTDERKKSEILSLVIEGFNYGVFSMLESKKAMNEKTLLQKSKEITSYLPDNFVSSETGKGLVDSLQECVKTNSKNYILNIGYEPIIAEDFSRILQIAYAIGITTGFSIAEDEELKDMYSANIDRFIKHGSGGNV